MPPLLRSAALLFPLAFILVLDGCKPSPPPPDTTGLAVRQTVMLAHPGEANERRVEVLEDERITPALHYWLWGASKEPQDFLNHPGVSNDKALAESMKRGPLLRGMVALVDHDGKILDARRLDCEIGQISLEPMPQSGGGQVWTLGDDCSTGEGDYAGIITHFFSLGDDKIAWQRYTDDKGETLELTVVKARRIDWRMGDPPRLDDITEASCHPDFDDPRFKALKPGEPMPADLPLVTDLIHYHYDGSGHWAKRLRTDKSAWYGGDGFPGPDQFPQ